MNHLPTQTPATTPGAIVTPAGTFIKPHFAVMLEKEHITERDIESMNEEAGEFFELLETLMLEKDGEELEDFLEKVEGVMIIPQMERLWERNQARIAWALKALTHQHGRMPTRTEIAEKTGLSRMTVYRHFMQSPHLRVFDKPLDQYRFFASAIMDKLQVNAMNGDVKAAKLFFERLDREIRSEKDRQYDLSWKEISKAIHAQEAADKQNKGV